MNIREIIPFISFISFYNRINNTINAFIAEPQLSNLSISEADYEALTYYDNRNYVLSTGAIYNRATLTTPPTDVYGGSDLPKHLLNHLIMM